VNGEVQVIANTFGFTGGVFHTIRRANGSWFPFRDVKGQSGDPGDVQTVGAAEIGGVLHLLAIVPDAGGNGTLIHTIRDTGGSWTPFAAVPLIGPAGGASSNVGRVTAASVDGALHVVIVVASGDVFHAVRSASGAWTPFGNVKGTAAGDPGRVQLVAAAGVGQELHLVIALDAGGLRHTIRRSNGQWVQFGNVNQVAGDPGRHGTISVAAVGSDIHVLTTTQADGGLFHTIRRANGAWTGFGNVKGQAGNPAPFIGVAGSGSGVVGELHVLASTGVLTPIGQLFHTVRRPDGTWFQFGDVKTQTGDPGQVGNVTAAG
jgi:hypothetical protein